MPTRRDLVNYWSAHQDECGLSIDWAEAETLCWRCAQGRELQFCHIVPQSLGGSGELRNLVLLCGQCHGEAPNVVDPDFMWVWLRAHTADLYGSYWYQRGLLEYERIFGGKPFSNLKDPEMALPKFLAAVATYCERTSTHWGQGRLNPSTIAWLLHKIVAAIRDP